MKCQHVRPGKLLSSYALGLLLSYVNIVRGALLRAAPRASKVTVNFDTTPTVVDTTLANMTMTFNLINVSRPSDGNPWFRYKSTSQRGEATHSHFKGMEADDGFRDDIVSAHNVVRQRGGLRPLAWDHSLASMAEDRTYDLAVGGCYIKHLPPSKLLTAAGFDYVGENLYKVIGMKPTGVDVADAWYAEVADYTFGSIGDACTKRKCASRSSPPCATGHYTQMMWANTNSIGCARKACTESGKPTYIVVCHYGPGGNRVSEVPFSGTTASRLGFSSSSC